MRESITGSSFMERIGGQRAGPPNSYRRDFAAVSRFLSPLQSRCACLRSTLGEPRDVRALALDPSWNDDGILLLTQTPSRIKSPQVDSQHLEHKNRPVPSPRRGFTMLYGARYPPGARVYPRRFVCSAHNPGLYAQAALLNDHANGRRYPLHARAQPPPRPD